MRVNASVPCSRAWCSLFPSEKVKCLEEYVVQAEGLADVATTRCATLLSHYFRWQLRALLFPPMSLLVSGSVDLCLAVSGSVSVSHFLSLSASLSVYIDISI